MNRRNWFLTAGGILAATATPAKVYSFIYNNPITNKLKNNYSIDNPYIKKLIDLNLMGEKSRREDVISVFSNILSHVIKNEESLHSDQVKNFSYVNSFLTQKSKTYPIDSLIKQKFQKQFLSAL